MKIAINANCHPGFTFPGHNCRHCQLQIRPFIFPSQNCRQCQVQTHPFTFRDLDCSFHFGSRISTIADNHHSNDRSRRLPFPVTIAVNAHSRSVRLPFPAKIAIISDARPKYRHRNGFRIAGRPMSMGGEKATVLARRGSSGAKNRGMSTRQYTEGQTRDHPRTRTKPPMNRGLESIIGRDETW